MLLKKHRLDFQPQYFIFNRIIRNKNNHPEQLQNLLKKLNKIKSKYVVFHFLAHRVLTFNVLNTKRLH